MTQIHTYTTLQSLDETHTQRERRDMKTYRIEILTTNYFGTETRFFEITARTQNSAENKAYSYVGEYDRVIKVTLVEGD